jgi:hypothetical protein
MAIKRRSAGMRSPDAKLTMSPGTSDATGKLCGCPSRSTVACSGTMVASDSMALAARNSCTKPISALSTTTASTTRPSVTLPMPIASPEDASSTQMSGLLICRQRMVQTESRRPRGTMLGPCLSRRRLASALLRPVVWAESSVSTSPGDLA